MPTLYGALASPRGELLHALDAVETMPTGPAAGASRHAGQPQGGTLERCLSWGNRVGRAATPGHPHANPARASVTKPIGAKHGNRTRYTPLAAPPARA